MSHASGRTQQRLSATLDRTLDVAMRIVPVGVLIAIGAYFTAEQAVRPEHRAIKVALMLGLTSFMFRFDMVYSVYLFTILFVFPTGISLASSNSVLMTVIPMIWAVRAASTQTRLMRKTVLDAPIAVFLLGYVLSFMNVESNHALVESIKVLWRQLACCAFFYMIVNFIDDEVKLTRLLKVLGVSCSLIMLTAVVELIAPGTVIIPGWIDLHKQLSEGGALTARVEKMRVGGVFGDHANLSDFGSQIFCFMSYFAWKVRNPAEKAFWSVATIMTMVAVLSSGNRGGLIGIGIAVLYTTYLFRHKMSFRRLSLTVTGLFFLMVSATYLLDKYTYATSPIDRLMHTEMHGMVPETRAMTWVPSIKKSMQHPFVGHGPYFEIGEGLTFQFWPHNGYLFYLQTLGLFGLGAFLWIMTRVYKLTLLHRGWRRESDPLGDLMALIHVWFVVFAIEQLRTDHQRDDIYPYLVWLLFGIAVAAAGLIRTENARAAHPGAGTAVTP